MQTAASKDEVARFWNSNPCGSALASGARRGTPEFFEQTEIARYVQEPFVKEFARFEEWRDKKVLEVGCGIGTDLSMFARYGAQTWGVDLTYTGAALSAQRLAYRGFNPRTIVADSESLPFPDGAFDLVYSWGVIHHTPNTEVAAKELLRVARPGGKVIAMIYHRRSLVAIQAYLYHGFLRGKPFRSLREVIATHLESPGTKAYTMSEARALFAELDDLRITPVVTPYDLRIGRARFMPPWVRSLVPSQLGYFLVLEGLKMAQVSSRLPKSYSRAAKAAQSIPENRRLPLICPKCLRFRGQEQLLDDSHACASCGVHYPAPDGIPVMLADDAIREAFNNGDRPSDARSSFYQYNKDYLRERVKGDEQIDYALANTTACGMVLELGSGRGVFAGKGGADYCALDYSVTNLRAYIDLRQRRVCASAETIPLLSGTCRLVFSFATFEHVPRPDLAFAEVDRVLAAGGVACIAPAWHCRDWAADGLAVRPSRDLTLTQKLRKALIPLRDSLIYRGAQQIPWRIWRRCLTGLTRAPSRLSYVPLRANYEQFWGADSDACSSIDSHEGILFFESRDYEILEPRGGPIKRLLFRAGPIIVRKTPRSPK